MNSELPALPTLTDIEKSNKKYGVWRTLRNQLQLLLPYLVMGTLCFFLKNKWMDPMDQRLASIENSISVSTQNKTTVISGSNNNLSLEAKASTDGTVLGNTTGYSKEDWIDTSFYVDNEGYSCHNKKGLDISKISR